MVDFNRRSGVWFIFYSILSIIALVSSVVIVSNREKIDSNQLVMGKQQAALDATNKYIAERRLFRDHEHNEIVAEQKVQDDRIARLEAEIKELAVKH
jgi:hypothetical protein